MDRDADPLSLLARAMRACDARGLRNLAQAINAEFDLRDQRLVDDALAAGELVAWCHVRRYRKCVRHRVVSCGKQPNAGPYGASAVRVRTLCKQLLPYAEVWPEGSRLFDRDGNDEHDSSCHKIETTCKKCLALLK